GWWPKKNAALRCTKGGGRPPKTPPPGGGGGGRRGGGQKTPGGVPPAATQGTNIEAALEAAVASLPPGYVPSVVLVSDGNETLGNGLKAALKAGLPVSTVPLATRNEPEVQVSAVTLPAQVRQGEPFYVEVLINSNHDDEGVVTVYRGPHEVVRETRALKKGENRFRFQQTVTSERLAHYTARVQGLKSDTLLDNNTESGLVFTAGK